ncbi:hypothetical protein ACI8AF_20480 [Blastococcus sp. SYSU D00669]
MPAERSDWVELRVHGVSGTPPDYMLGSAHTAQVAGDDRSRCFRPTDSRGREVPAPDGHVLEAFHWGRWTSGSWVQGLWLLLIPFGILNAAHHTLPSGPGRPARAARALAAALLRLVGLVLTGLFALATCLVVVDLAAWQWLADLGPVPGWLVVDVALAVAALLIAGLSGLGQADTGRRYRFAAAGPCDLGRGAGGPAALGDAAFFDGDPDNPALRLLHRAAGLLVVGWLGLSVAVDAGVGWAAVPRGGVAVVLALVAAAVSVTGRGQADGPARWRSVAAVAVRVLSWAAVLLALAALAGADVDGAGPLPGTTVAVAVLVVAGFGGLALLVLSVAVLAAATRTAARVPPRPFRRFAGGLAAGLAASIGCYLAVGLTAGLTLGVQGLLNGLFGASVQGPALLQRFSYAWGVTAAVFAVLGGLAAPRLRRDRRRFRDRAEAAMTFGDPPVLHLPARWVARTGRAMQTARLKNAIPQALAVWTLLGLVLAGAIGAAFVLDREPPVPLGLLTGASSAAGGAVTGDDVVIGLGQVTLLGIAAAAVLLARGALRSEGARRGLNVVWDVVAFWPRASHPFVPPPYAQEVVPALVRRICWHLGVPDPLQDTGADADRRAAPVHNPDPAPEVVVAAHSQGSLIALVALLWLPAEVRGRVRWVTFGSQLRSEFARGFPHYVTVDLLREVAAAFRWVSLYRDTDPVAGPVTSWDHSPDGGPLTSRRMSDPDRALPDWLDPDTGRRVCGDEWRLLDPVPGDLALQTRAVTGPGGHGGYWTDPDWPLALDVVRGRVPDGRVPRARVSRGPAAPPAAGRAPHPAVPRQRRTPPGTR